MGSLENSFFLLFDLAAVGFGVFLLINPNKAYNFGSKDGEKREVPKKWYITGRIIGAVLLIIGALFIISRFW